MTQRDSRDAPFGDHRKAVLFCPDCGHASATDGDWIRHERGEETVYECPRCGATVTSRATQESA